MLTSTLSDLLFLLLFFPDAAALGNNHFRVAPSSAQFTDIQCNGSENFLLNCTHSTTTGCTAATDAAGVSCLGPVGECEMAGFTTCCEKDCLVGSCRCDSGCLLNDTVPCCSDAAVLCASPSEYMYSIV